MRNAAVAEEGRNSTTARRAAAAAGGTRGARRLSEHSGVRVVTTDHASGGSGYPGNSGGRGNAFDTMQRLTAGTQAQAAEGASAVLLNACGGVYDAEGRWRPGRREGLQALHAAGVDVIFLTEAGIPGVGTPHPAGYRLLHSNSGPAKAAILIREGLAVEVQQMDSGQRDCWARLLWTGSDRGAQEDLIPGCVYGPARNHPVESRVAFWQTLDAARWLQRQR